MHRITTGDWIRCSQAEEPFRRVLDELTIADVIIYCSTTPFIPPRLRKKVFHLCHDELLWHSKHYLTITTLCLVARHGNRCTELGKSMRYLLQTVSFYGSLGRYLASR